MQIKRIKSHKRIMRIYTTYCGFFSPFHVIVDGTFLHAALRHRLDLFLLLSQHLGHPVSLFTTSCLLQELRSLGSDYLPTYLAAQRFTKRHCHHASSFTCLTSGHPYCVIASNDSEVRHQLRLHHPEIPLLYLVHGLVVMEKPSSETIQVLKENHAKEMLEKGSNDVNTSTSPSDLTESIKKKRKRKQPNPLSVKKKKVNKVKNAVSSSENMGKLNKKKKKHRKRRHSKKSDTGSSVIVDSSSNLNTVST